MYVVPFWSYMIIPEGCRITNWLTKKSGLFSSDMLGFLERLYDAGAAGAGTVESDELLANARTLELVFDSERAAADWLEENERGWFLDSPIIEQIELTNRCPYSCKMCPRTVAMSRALGNMPLDLFEHILTQISGRQSYIGLHHFGESLLHSGLAEAVSMARRYGLKTGLSCNPPTLRPGLAASLLKAGISNLVLSLDSLHAETYREIRGEAALLERADRNLRELIRLRDEGGYETFITLQMINMRCNATEADRFLDYCQEVSVDRGVVIRLGRWDFDDDYVEQLGGFDSPGYGGYCTRPWDSVVVLWDGRVVPCCHDYDGISVLGDLKAQSLEEIWHSAQAERFRRFNHEYELCRRCAFSRWYREQQRKAEGFRRFHRERGDGRERKEWINPQALARIDGRLLFDGFDILVDEE